MKRSIIFVVLFLFFCTVWTADAKLLVPELIKGDILLCEEYTYRTVKNTSRTVYHLARMGFSNVRSFQDAHGMKADGVIGPKTQQKAESEFNKQFNVKTQKYNELNMISLSLSSELKENNIAVTVTMRNKSDDLLSIVGSIIYDSNGNFLFQDPIIPLVKKYVIRENGRIAYGFGPWAEVIICAKSTTIKSSQQVSNTASLPKLDDNQSGWMSIKTTYIDSTLSTGNINVQKMIPKEKETEKSITSQLSATGYHLARLGQ